MFFEFLQPAAKPVIDGLEEHEIVLGKDQPEYVPLRVLVGRTPEGRAISRWSPTPEQRHAIANGADIFLTQLTFGNPFHPVNIVVSDGPNPDFFREQLGLPGSEYDRKLKENHELFLKERDAYRRAAEGELGKA